MNGQWELPKDGKIEDLTVPHDQKSSPQKTGRQFDPMTQEELVKDLMSLERDVTISPETKGRHTNFFSRFVTKK